MGNWQLWSLGCLYLASLTLISALKKSQFQSLNFPTFTLLILVIPNMPNDPFVIFIPKSNLNPIQPTAHLSQNTQTQKQKRRKEKKKNICLSSLFSLLPSQPVLQIQPPLLYLHPTNVFPQPSPTPLTSSKVNSNTPHHIPASILSQPFVPSKLNCNQMVPSSSKSCFSKWD